MGLHQTHILTTTTSAFPNYNTFADDSRDFCTIFLKLNSSCHHEYKRIHLDAKYGEYFCRIISKHSKVLENCSKWPKNYLRDSREQAYDKDSVNAEIKELLFMYAKDNVAKVSLFFNEPVIKKEIRDIKLSRVMFMANVGGILGLAMGASIITLFEVLYHVGRLVSLCGWRITPTLRKSLIPHYSTRMS